MQAGAYNFWPGYAGHPIIDSWVSRGKSVSSVFATTPGHFDLLFTAEGRPIAADPEGFRYQNGTCSITARAVIGTTRLDHPYCLTVPYYYFQPYAAGPPRPQTFGVTAVFGNVHHGTLAAARVKLLTELSKCVPVYVNSRCAAYLPQGHCCHVRDVGPGLDDKLEFISSYTHTLCPENISLPGYITEKIGHALMAATIPLYAGAPDITDWIDPAAFVDISGMSASAVVAAMSRPVPHKAEAAFLQTWPAVLAGMDSFVDNL